MEDWHLKKGVSLAIIVVLIAYLVMGVWNTSALYSLVSSHGEQIAKNTKNIEKTRDYQYKIGTRLTKIEENQKYQKEILIDIKKAVK